MCRTWAASLRRPARSSRGWRLERRRSALTGSPSFSSAGSFKARVSAFLDPPPEDCQEESVRGREGADEGGPLAPAVRRTTVRRGPPGGRTTGRRLPGDWRPGGHSVAQEVREHEDVVL